MDPNRSNTCPRCGFVYTAYNRPHPPRQGLINERRAHPRLGKPWQCVCGAWLRSRQRTFGWADVLGIVVITAVAGAVAFRYWWVLTPPVLGVALAAWIGVRHWSDAAVEEVSGPDAESLPVA